MKLNKPEAVLSCFHCGNKTVMKRVAEYNENNIEQIWHQPYGDTGFFYDIEFNEEWHLFLCPVCRNVTLKHNTSSSEDADSNGFRHINEKVLYPFQSVEESNIPKNVASAYEAALKVSQIDTSLCAIGIRRTLEMMCKEKGEEGRSLYHMLKALSDKGTLPPILNEMAAVLRKVGNSAAHADEEVLSADLIPPMIDFTKTILDYVYNLPKQIEKIQNQLSENESKESQSSSV